MKGGQADRLPRHTRTYHLLQMGVTLTEQGLVDEHGLAFPVVLDWLREIDNTYAETREEMRQNA